MRRALLVLAVVLCGSDAAADSDGYYCAGPTYLAYQFGVAAPPVAPHRLHIIRVGDEGIAAPVVFELPQFQVHGMRCGERTIEMRAFDAVHVITLDARAQPVRHATTPMARLNAPVPAAESFALPANLGMLSRPRGSLTVERVHLATDARQRQYLLEIAPSRVAACSVDITSRVVQRDATGRELAARVIFEGPVRRECGD